MKRCGHAQACSPHCSSRMASNSSQHSSHIDRPERSRNAKAQARHRAKRKAYIEQLEQTVAKLQLALGMPAEQLSVLPPPSIRIRELEVENARLGQENEELRQALNNKNSNGAGENSHGPGLSDFSSNRDSRRRRDDDYLVPSLDMTSPIDRMTPPSLTIPSGTHLQPYSPHPLSTQASSSSSGYSLPSGSHNQSPFHHTMPPTPSSGSSSPSFTSTQLHSHSQSPVSTRSPIMTHPSGGYSSYAASQQHIKIEEDAYMTSSQSSSQSASFPLSTYSHGADMGTEGWHYTSESRPFASESQHYTSESSGDSRYESRIQQESRMFAPDSRRFVPERTYPSAESPRYTSDRHPLHG